MPDGCLGCLADAFWGEFAQKYSIYVAGYNSDVPNFFRSTLCGVSNVMPSFLRSSCCVSHPPNPKFSASFPSRFTTR